MLFLTSIELKVNKKSVTANISCGHFNQKFESNAPREQSFVNQFFRNERTCQFGDKEMVGSVKKMSIKPYRYSSGTVLIINLLTHCFLAFCLSTGSIYLGRNLVVDNSQNSGSNKKSS